MGSSPFDLSSILNTCSITTTGLNLVDYDAIKTTLLNPFNNTMSPSANRGLLGDYTNSGWTGNTYMTFLELNDPERRNTWLTSRYNYLKGITYTVGDKTKYIIPTNPNLNDINNRVGHSPDTLNPVAAYNEEIVNFLRIVATEYCYYQRNYFIALNKFLSQYSDASTTGSLGNRLTELQDDALDLNRKVNTLISFINYLSNKNIANLSTLQPQINSLNGNIAASTASLKTQADILTNYNKSNELFRQMTEYTEEKNRANQNLIAVYFTLNVVAIASLFIIARSL
jgi:hypothetical protein